MSEIGGVDPSVFEKRNEAVFCIMLCEADASNVEAKNVIEKYEIEHSDEARDGTLREFKDSQIVKGLTDILGDGLVAKVSISAEADPLEDAKYEESLDDRTEAVDTLVGHMLGYGSYMEDNLKQVYGDEDEEAITTAWNVAWTKLRDSLKLMEGTYLAEVADLFDDIIGWKYEGFYDHTDRLRGAVVAQDVAARMFYEVIEDHLKRSIVKRGDEWSG